MSTAPDNFRRLRDAGIVLTDDCPEEYQAVIDGLEENEVQVLLDVWERLQSADRDTGAEFRPGEVPRFTNCMFF